MSLAPTTRPPSPPPDSTSRSTLLGPDEVAEWIADHAAEPADDAATITRAGLAVAGTWGRGTGTLTGIAIAAPTATAPTSIRPR